MKIVSLNFGAMVAILWEVFRKEVWRQLHLSFNASLRLTCPLFYLLSSTTFVRNVRLFYLLKALTVPM